MKVKFDVDETRFVCTHLSKEFLISLKQRVTFSWEEGCLLKASKVEGGISISDSEDSPYDRVPAKLIFPSHFFQTSQGDKRNG